MELLMTLRILPEAIRRTELPLMHMEEIMEGPVRGDWRAGIQMGHAKFEISFIHTRGDVAEAVRWTILKFRIKDQAGGTNLGVANIWIKS